MASAGALLLTPGAGSDRDHHTLVALERGAGVLVERVDFPYRRAGRRAPDRAPVAVAHLRDEAAKLVARQHIRAGRLVLGGRSYGGRMCSVAVAEGVPAAGLVLLSYPLHPPGKPHQLRVEHFPALEVPCLFVSGEKDPFGSPEEIRAAAKAIPGAVEVRFVAGSHDPRGKDDEIVSFVREWLRALR
jgi:predicted alpha/beta-hydrolase family hydrolase